MEGLTGFSKLPSTVHSEFFPIELFDNTRGYLVSIANQALASYNYGIFDGCAILTRKLIEILIIECFERHGIVNLITLDNDNFYSLSDLIEKAGKVDEWKLSKETKSGLSKIKKLGNLSAHNRRYRTRKQDLDSIKGDVRIVIEEFIHLIDYKAWKK